MSCHNQPPDMHLERGTPLMWPNMWILLCVSECCSMAYRLGGGPAVTHLCICGGRLERRCSSSSFGLAGKEAAGRGVQSLSAGTELVSQAQIQMFGPLPASWRVVATLSPRASLAALRCMPMGNQQRTF